MNTGRNGVGAAGRLLAATVLIGRLFMLSALALGALAVAERVNEIGTTGFMSLESKRWC